MTAFSDMAHAPRKLRGVSAVEALAGLAIGSAILATTVGVINRQLDDQRASTLASQYLTFAQAAERYIADLQTTNGTLKIDASDLKALKYLPSNYDPKNVFGQTLCVRRSVDKASWLLVAEGGTPIDPRQIGVRDLAAQRIQPGAQNFLDANLNFRGVSVSTVYPPPGCGDVPTAGTLAVPLNVRRVPDSGLAYIHRFPYSSDSNLITGTLDMNGNDIGRVGVASASSMTSLSGTDTINSISAFSYDVGTLAVSALVSNQKIAKLSATSMTVLGGLVTDNTITVGDQFYVGTQTIPIASGSCNAASENTFAHINGLPHICKDLLWQPIQIGMGYYQKDSVEGYPVDRITMGCNAVGANQEVLVAGGGATGAHSSSEQAYENYYFEANNLSATSGQLKTAFDNIAPFYVGSYPGPVAPNPDYQSSFRQKSNGIWIGQRDPYQKNASLDRVGVSQNYGAPDDEGARSSGTSDWRSTTDGYAAVGNKVRAAVVCARGMGLKTVP